MGILDDAIRQHLDLKRRLGAGEDELARLEDEAFGLPSRPGDPDFPETGSEPEQPAEGTVASLPEKKEHSEEPSAFAPATEQGPAAEAPATPEVTAAQTQAPAAEEAPTPAPAPIAEISEPTTPPTSGVDTVEHEISPEPDEDDRDLNPDAVEQQKAEPERSAGEHTDAPGAGSGTDEQSALEDTGEAEMVEGELEEPAAELGEDEGDGGEDEDVLEETPEFLRDQPEDDELWFEQGEPKDFDF